MNITYYCFIGIVFTFVLDIVMSAAHKHPKIQKIHWGWWERSLCITFWPLALIIFIYSFYKEFSKW